MCVDTGAQAGGAGVRGGGAHAETQTPPPLTSDGDGGGLLCPPDHDAPSLVLAERALEALGASPAPKPGRGRSKGGLMQAQQAAAVACLTKWLPAGPVSGASPVAAVAEEQVRV